MKKLLLSFLIAYFSLSSVVFAQDFSININMKEQYLAGYTDYIILKINNPLPEDWFTIGLIGPEKWIYAEDSLLRVSSGGSNEIRIVVQPPKDVIPPAYPYQYFLKVTRVGGDELEKSLLINIVQTTNAILKDLTLSCTECLDNVDISGTIYNVGSRTLDLAIVLKIADQQKTVSIGKLDIFQKKDFQTSFSLKDMTPGDYVVEAKVVDSIGNNLYADSASFKIPAIENIIYDKQVSSTPFGSMITVTATNMGNVVSFADLKSTSPKTWYSIYSGPSPTGMAIGDYYSWRVSLEPKKSTSVSYSEIYWPTYAVIIFAILAAVFIYWQSTAFTFTKNVMSGKNIKGGKEISVSLDIRNKRRDIDKAVIRDIVPSDFSIVSKFDTVKPLIRKIPKGIELNWKVGELKPHEERVLHYTIKPSTEVVRRASLPSAAVKVLRNKRVILKHSNKVYLSPEQEEVKVVTVKVSK